MSMHHNNNSNKTFKDKFYGMFTVHFFYKIENNDIQPFYNILTFKRRLWSHTVLYWPHIVLLLHHILLCVTPWRWPRGAETCRSVCIYKVVQIWPGLFVCKQVTVCPGHIWTTLYNKHTEVHLLDIIIHNRLKINSEATPGKHSVVSLQKIVTWSTGRTTVCKLKSERLGV